MLSRLIGIGFFGAALTAAACSGASVDGPISSLPSASSTVVLNVAPAMGATSVDPAGTIQITFNHPMMTGMEMLVVLHESSVTGPTLAGTSTWSADHTTLTFTPAQPLKSKTMYVLHFSPNLKDANGNSIDFASCAQRLGGKSPASTGLSGGMMGGGMGPGMMGDGWQAGSGPWGFGMIFSFTTA